MSAPSLNSLETAYGSCVGSDAGSILSTQTFCSVKSNSTLFLSGDSDTDTLVNDGDDDDRSELFYDVLTDFGGGLNEEDMKQYNHDLPDFQDPDPDPELLSSLVEYGLRSSTPVPIRRTPSPQPTETARLLEPSVQIPAPEPSVSGDDVFRYQPVVTRIAARPICQPAEKRRSSNSVHMMYFIFLVACSLGFQTCLRYNTNLSSWVLVLWRGVFQIFLGLLVMSLKKVSIFGEQGTKTKLFLHTVLGSLSVFAQLFSSERVSSSNLAAIFLFIPVGALVLEHLIKRGLLYSHMCLFVLLTWTSSVLLLSRKMPWPTSPSFNATNESLIDIWQPPIFALDNVHMWPIQPVEYSLLKNQTSTLDETKMIPGLVVGIIGLLFSSSLPVLVSSSTRDILWPCLMWQGVGAVFTSTIGIFLNGDSFLFASETEWLFGTLIAILGLLGNITSVCILTLKSEDLIRRGWAPPKRFIPGITIGVVVRSALETIAIFGINFSGFRNETVSLEDGLGLAFMLLVGLFCCFVKSAKESTTNSSSQETPLCGSE